MKINSAIINRTKSKPSTVASFLRVSDAEKEMGFIKNVFRANVTSRVKNPDGSLMQGELLIGNSVIMVGKAFGKFSARKGMNYVFVTDVKATYQRALDNGATSLQEPAKMFYGYFEACIEDMFGNIWLIGQELESLSDQAIEKNLANTSF